MATELATKDARTYSRDVNPEFITLENLHNTTFVDPRDQVATKATRLLWGGGWNVSVVSPEGTIDEEKGDKLRVFLQKNKFAKLILRNEYAMSYYGSIINTISRTRDGGLLLGESVSDGTQSNITKIELIEEISAIVWKRLIYDDIHYKIREKWDTEKVVRDIFNENGDEVQLQGFNAKVPPELRMKKTERHTYSGMLPIVQFRNREKYASNPNNLDVLSDTYSVRHIENAVNFTFRSEIQEQFLDTTRIFGSFTTQQMKGFKMNKINAFQATLSQLILNVSQGIIDSGKENALPIVTQQASLAQLTPLMNMRARHMHDYYTGSGYSYSTGEEATNTNSSVLYAKGGDIETTREKRNMRQEDYSILLAKILFLMGELTLEELDTWKVIFTIKENIVQSQDQLIMAELKLVETGLISKARALANIKGIELMEAESWIEEAEKEIKAQQTESDKRLMAQYQAQVSSDMGAPQEEPGQPAEPKLG